MASVMGINKIGLPKLSENMDPEDARALRSYLYQMHSGTDTASRTRLTTSKFNCGSDV